MSSRPPASPPPRVDYRALAAFRHEIRRFLHASELAARDEGLKPQQHQVMLAIRGEPDDTPVTLAHLADRLQLRHNSVVGLVDRLTAQHLAQRSRDPLNRRRALVTLTPKGERALRRLSVIHQQELRSRAPGLIGALTAVVRGAGRRA